MVDKKFVRYFSIFLIWLFTISGISGISTPEYSEWFLSMTPFNLMLTFLIGVVNINDYKWQYIVAISIPFCLGFITEALGVNFGLIFGNYAYGENLGYKVFGVPLMICVNWATLTMATADIAKLTGAKLVWRALIGAALMTGLDFFIEVSAPDFDFWEFENGIVPIQNYIGWFVTAFVAHLGYQTFKVSTNTTISWHIFISIAVFFIKFALF